MNSLMVNIIDVVKEGQIKLGYRKEYIRLYYPLSSLNTMLGMDLDAVNMQKYLTELFEAEKEVFGPVEITHREERFCIRLSDQTSEYVHTHTEQSGFLYDFIDAMSRHGVTIEEVLALFEKYGNEVHFETMKDEEFDYLIYFADGKPDAYRYCLTSEGHHMIYHRFTKEDYEAMYG